MWLWFLLLPFCLREASHLPSCPLKKIRNSESISLPTLFMRLFQGELPVSKLYKLQLWFKSEISRKVCSVAFEVW